jgi:RNA polymerase sigma factor (sigma-70 family)
LITDLDKELIPLIDKISQGDKNASNEFYQRVYSHLREYFGYLRLTKLDFIDIEDIIQETFIKFHQKTSNQSDSVQSPERLLLSIARHTAIDMLRKEISQRKHKRLARAYALDLALPTSNSQGLDTHDKAEAIIKKYFPRLRSDSRAIIESIIFQGRSFRETAELLGIDQNLARVRYHRAIQQLRDLVNRGDHELNRIQDNLSRLEERDRSILGLILVQGVSPKDAASVLGVQPATIYKRYERALKRLKSLTNNSND